MEDDEGVDEAEDGYTEAHEAVEETEEADPAENDKASRKHCMDYLGHKVDVPTTPANKSPPEAAPAAAKSVLAIS